MVVVVAAVCVAFSPVAPVFVCEVLKRFVATLLLRTSPVVHGSCRFLPIIPTLNGSSNYNQLLFPVASASRAVSIAAGFGHVG